MTASSYPRQDDGSGRRPRVDAGRLWMGGLATARLAALVAVLAPFTTGADLDTKVATAAINLAIGLAIGSLVPGMARSAIRLGERPAAAGRLVTRVAPRG